MDESTPNEVTQLLVGWRRGNERARDRLLTLVYDELHRRAEFYMRGERSDHTLQPTALVHEAYARMVNMELTLQDRAHFFSIAAGTMRRVLVEYSRAHGSAKRGGDAIRVALDPDELPATADTRDLVDVDRALTRLQELDDRQGQVVELHYFGGMSYLEIADTLQMSPATVGRAMRYGKAWLRRELS